MIAAALVTLAAVIIGAGSVIAAFAFARSLDDEPEPAVWDFSEYVEQQFEQIAAREEDDDE